MFQILLTVLCLDGSQNTNLSSFSYLLCLTLCLINTEGIGHLSLPNKDTNDTGFSVMSESVLDRDSRGSSCDVLHVGSLHNANYDVMCII